MAPAHSTPEWPGRWMARRRSPLAAVDASRERQNLLHLGALLPQAEREGLLNEFAAAEFFVSGTKDGINFPALRGLRARGPGSGIESILTPVIPGDELRCVFHLPAIGAQQEAGRILFDWAKNSGSCRLSAARFPRRPPCGSAPQRCRRGPKCDRADGRLRRHRRQECRRSLTAQDDGCFHPLTCVHSSAPPRAVMAARTLRRASKRRVLIVPSGMPVCAAISRWLRPRK